MTNKELNELRKLNAVINSIDRVIAFGLHLFEQATTDDLQQLKMKLHNRRMALVAEKEQGK